MTETKRRACENRGVFTAVMTDLSKAFDCISHNYLTANLNAYGFGETSLYAIISVLKILNNRTQTTKVDSPFLELLNIVYGVPQESILGPLLYIIYLYIFVIFLL